MKTNTLSYTDEILINTRERYQNPRQASREAVEMLLKTYASLHTGERTHEFSRWRCECCDSPLAGERHEFYALKKHGERYRAVKLGDCCTDCFYEINGCA